MVERAVRYFLLQFFVGKLEGLDILGAVEVRAPALDNAVDEHNVENATVPVRIYGESAEVFDCVILSGPWSA